MRNANKIVTVHISGPALALLKKLDYPCSEEILASAVPTEEGVELSGTESDFESLAGFVAGDANHADRRARRKLELLYEISDTLEAALDGRGASW
jgi:hypothetical protein